LKSKLNLLAGTLILLLLTVGCQNAATTNHVSFSDKDTQVIEEYLNREVMEPSFGGEVFSAYEILGTDDNAEKIYIWALILEYYKTDTALEVGTGMSLPMVLHVEQTEDSLQISSHTMPRDGSYYQEDVETLFPNNIQSKIFDYPSKHIDKLSDELDNKVEKELEK